MMHSSTRHSLRLARCCRLHQFARNAQHSRRFSSPATSGLASVIKLSDEIADAVATNKPIVALESTIYTHGALGRELPAFLESVVRDNGAIPATIGVLDGVPVVGLTPTEIDRMVDEGAKKLSRRDLSYVLGMVSPAPA